MANQSHDTIVVDGRALADELRAELASEVAALVASGRRPPCLAVVLVGDDPASASYIKGKRRACERVGLTSVEHKLAASASEAEVLERIAALNRDDGIDGILVQLPLPKGLRPNQIASAIDPAKDVDGLHPLNAGRLLLGEPCLAPCTPLAILKLLEHFEVPLAGAHAVVIGRSDIVGKPVALLLLRAHASVTMCHSRTRGLAEHCRRADVIAAGVPRPCAATG
jgi:methylenetetrahydrofolate dehydrogenase (NADP+)/methenyltetrahydrofolate cyclohydrolase